MEILLAVIVLILSNVITAFAVYMLASAEVEKKNKKKEQKAEARAKAEDLRKLRAVLENIQNYDGTDRGQVSVDR